ncbi:tRNA glutamyl-Q(34) synthetase GluQRS [Sphingomonas sp. PB2P19]|uniref:tRNA glutamyl-Q(34) synthetase GluQRS n=1 Tax=Sphingomonas rhamnosi TaxID=3096156 RepID=UPI002FCB7B0D
MTARSGSRGQPFGRGVVTRFAPSPTGRLHLGHAVSAIRAHDFARTCGGRFVLRIEDIDGTRSRPEHVAGILEDLRWLGLDWDELVIQSERLATYADALERLRAMGLVYPCVCTRAEIAASASAPQGDMPQAYPGSCRIAPPALDKPHCWRLDMAAALAATGPVTWHDATAGTVVADPRPQGDIVLARKDAPSSYHLAVTLDDAAQGVTDVVRGVDLFAATHVHRVLQALLGLPVPAYHHHPLVTGPDGRRLAKRDGAPTLEARRLAGEDGLSLAEDLRVLHPPLAGEVAGAARRRGVHTK